MTRKENYLNQVMNIQKGWEFINKHNKDEFLNIVDQPNELFKYENGLLRICTYYEDIINYKTVKRTSTPRIPVLTKLYGVEMIVNIKDSYWFIYTGLGINGVVDWRKLSLDSFRKLYPQLLANINNCKDDVCFTTEQLLRTKERRIVAEKISEEQIERYLEKFEHQDFIEWNYQTTIERKK